MKKVAAIISVLVFLASIAFFLYSNTFKTNNINSWNGNLNSDGTWLGIDNSNVVRAASVQRVNGYIIDFSQKEDDPTYFLTLKVRDDVTNEIIEIQIPKKTNSDLVKVTEDEIVAGIRTGEPIVVTVATDLKTKEQNLEFISIIPTEE